MRRDAENGFAEGDGEREACCGADESSDEAESGGFGEEKSEHAARRSADGFHQADVVLALHGDVGHRGHDAERGEDEDDADSRCEQAADALVDFSFGFSELANAVDVGIWNFFLQKKGNTCLSILPLLS